LQHYKILLVKFGLIDR